MRLATQVLPAAALLLSPTHAQTPPSPTGSAAPTIHVYSRETIINVLVTDDKGQPVRGLTKSDFTVEEDNEPQPIRSFYEVDRTTPPTPGRTLPPNTYTNSTALPASGPVQIFLFDLLGSRPDDMERAKKYIANYLRTMPANTQVALFAFSPSKDLRLLQGFASDGPAAAKIVDNLDVEWLRNPVKPTPIAIAGMNQIAAYVAGVHGRKNLIWIVAGMPLMITRDGGLAWAIGAPPDMTIIHRLMDLYDLFTREQIAIYPLDPRGVHGLGAGSLQAEEVAIATGGTTDNTNDYKGELTKVVDQSSHFYTLSYVPTRPDEDGHFHPIKITVDHPGVQLSYRTGYNDEQPKPPDPALVHDMIQGPMRLGAMPATQILFDMHVQPGTTKTPTQPRQTPTPNPPPTPHTKGAPYSIEFQLNPAQLSYTEDPDSTRICTIEFDLGAFDNFSQLITARTQTLKISLTPTQYDEFLRKPFPFTLPIDLPPGKLTLRAGVFDTNANHAGTLEIPLTVPKTKK